MIIIYPITNTLSEDTKLVQEYQEDEDRTNELNQEKINTEETALQGSPVGKLILYDLLRYIPAQEQAGKESSQRKEYLPRNEVEPIEQRLSEERKLICCTQRERAEGSDDGTGSRNDGSTLLEVYLQFLVEERGIHLMK